MTNNVLFNPLKHDNGLIIPRFTLTSPQPAPEPANFSSKVTISEEARSVQASGKQKAVTAGSKKADELRALLSKYDFNNITPRQMANLGGELFKQGEISQDVACSFIGTEKDTVVELDENKPINMNKHFDFMLSVVTDAASKETGFEFGLTYRQNASQALNDIQSFVKSDRLHIAT
jgi:hypothetical protein